jgi:diguanylate cyclase (GGDEF)-like protein
MWTQFGNMTRKISSDYARFYTDKLVGDLGIYINREIGIAVSLSKNSSILDWMTNENDSNRKAIAFHELQSFLQIFHDKNGFIALEGSKQVAYLSGKSGLLETEAEGILNSNNTEDAWYFRTMGQTVPYNINIAYDRLLHVTRVWINVKVQEEGRNLGVFGTGITIDSILQNIFSKYQQKGIKSLIINENGQVVLDSDYSKSNLDNSSASIGVNQSVFQYSDDPQFAKQFQDYIAAYNQPTVVQMDKNYYQYAAFAPILNSNWHVVTFFRRSALYTPVNFGFVFSMFLVIVLVLSFVISLIVKRIVTSPFEKLKASLQGKEVHQNHMIYGLERKDEFGELANSIQKMADRIVQSVPVGIFLMDTTRRLIYGNPSFLSQFECESREQFQQWADHDPTSLFVNKDDLVRVKEFFHELKESVFFDVELYSRNQQPFWAEIHLTKVPNQQSGYHYEGILINVQVKKKYEQDLLDLATTDRLTGVFNRHHFEQVVMGELDRYEQLGVACNMIFFDLDHFKCVNDNWGHDVGDRVLVDTAETIRQCTRHSDIIVRWGGEEFAILLPSCSLSEGGHVAENIRLRLESQQHPSAGIITASFGVTQRRNQETYVDWFKRTDQALYRAKQLGRNVVVIDE